MITYYMMQMVKRKFVIFVGKKTVNGMCFMNGCSPVSFPQRTLDEEDTEEFFRTDKLNERYINRLVEVINSFITIFYDKGCNLEEISIYAASEFRTSLSEDDTIYLKMKIFERTGVHSFILTKELEQLYIQNIIPMCQNARYIVRIMSTATIVYSINDYGEMRQFRFEKLGTAMITSLLSEIKGIRRKLINAMDEALINDCIDKLKRRISRNINTQKIDLKQCMAIYLGGEIDFLKALKYDLDKNSIFNDKEHEYSITYDSFYEQSLEKVLKKSQDNLNNEAVDLELAWKEGIKPCTLIAIALFQLLGIKVIIPSNKKEFYGMHYKNFQNIVITGSKKKNGKEIEAWVDYFNSRGINVYSPQIENKDDLNEILEEAHHLQAINQCDTLIVCNSSSDGYIGDATLFDIGYALAKEKRVITTQKPTKDVFNLIAVEIGIYEEG